VIQEVTWEGTQDGDPPTPEGRIPASGKRVTICAVQVLECEDGKIKRNRHYFDMLGMLQQLGAWDRFKHCGRGTRGRAVSVT